AAAPPTRKATVTRSASSSPVARLTTTFALSAISLSSLWLPIYSGWRAGQRGREPEHWRRHGAGAVFAGAGVGRRRPKSALGAAWLAFVAAELLRTQGQERTELRRRSEGICERLTAGERKRSPELSVDLRDDPGAAFVRPESTASCSSAAPSVAASRREII